MTSPVVDKEIASTSDNWHHVSGLDSAVCDSGKFPFGQTENVVAIGADSRRVGFPAWTGFAVTRPLIVSVATPRGSERDRVRSFTRFGIVA